MNVRQARQIIAVAEEGSVSRAAQRLGVSQPAISQTIRMAEREIGMKIFSRCASAPFLTCAGEKYLGAARRLLALEENLGRELGELKDAQHGKIRVGISPVRAMFLLPRVLPEFMEKYPGVEVELVETGTADLDEVVLDGKVDVAFLLSMDQIYPDLCYIPLYRERLVLIAGPGTALAKRKEPRTGIQIREAREEGFISLRRGHGMRALQDRMFYENRMAPKILFETGSAEAARRLAIVCGGVTLFPEMLLETVTSETAPREVWYPVLGNRYLRDFFLCYHKDRFLPRYLREFIRMTRAAVPGGEGARPRG